MNIWVRKIKDNFFLWSKIKNIMLLLDKKECRYNKFVNKIEKIDSIENYDFYTQILQEVI